MASCICSMVIPLDSFNRGSPPVLPMHLAMSKVPPDLPRSRIGALSREAFPSVATTRWTAAGTSLHVASCRSSPGIMTMYQRCHGTSTPSAIRCRFSRCFWIFTCRLLLMLPMLPGRLFRPVPLFRRFVVHFQTRDGGDRHGRYKRRVCMCTKHFKCWGFGLFLVTRVVV
jgi:hypothetical protein